MRFLIFIIFKRGRWKIVGSGAVPRRSNERAMIGKSDSSFRLSLAEIYARKQREPTYQEKQCPCQGGSWQRVTGEYIHRNHRLSIIVVKGADIQYLISVKQQYTVSSHKRACSALFVQSRNASGNTRSHDLLCWRDSKAEPLTNCTNTFQGRPPLISRGSQAKSWDAKSSFSIRKFGVHLARR